MFIIQRQEKGKPVSESALDNQCLEITSNDISPLGIVISSHILHISSYFALQVAKNHAETNCENIGIDYVRFYSAVRKDDKLFCSIAINKIWGSIIDVGVKVIAEDFRLIEQKHVLSAYFLYKAVDDEGNMADIHKIIPESDEERRRYINAEKRRQQRNKR